MANPWFRLYHEFADDPKVQMMSECMQRRFVMLLCERCKGETLRETERAFHWRISESELADTKVLFMGKGFIDENWNLLNWNKRQFLSDSSTERVRRHRQAKKQSGTLHETDETQKKLTHGVTETAPDTDSDNRVKKQNGDDARDARTPDPPSPLSPVFRETAALVGEKLREFAPCDPDSDEEGSIPDDLTLIQYRQFACERLGIAKSYGNQVALQDGIEAIMQHEHEAPATATRLVIQRGRDHPPEKGNWRFWVNDGGWKQKALFTGDWDLDLTALEEEDARLDAGNSNVS